MDDCLKAKTSTTPINATDSTKHYRCKCGKKYSWLKGLRRHQRQYGNKEPKNEYDICKKTFHRLDNLKRHLDDYSTTPINANGSIKRYRCKCGRIYSWLRCLQRHQIQCGNKEPKFECDICKKRFHRLDMLRRHLDYCLKATTSTTPINANGSTKRYKCNLCGKKYSWLKGLRRHQLQCGNKEPKFECDICKLRFYRLEMLRRHLDDCLNAKTSTTPINANDSTKRYRCNLCGKKYRWSYGLRRHELQCGNKDPKNECDFCKRRFYRLDKLKSHLLTHKVSISKRKT